MSSPAVPSPKGDRMARVKLDDIERRILRDLQDDGRITNVELARRAGISPPPWRLCLVPSYPPTVFSFSDFCLQGVGPAARP